jgi:hypothetical protein
MAVPATNGIIKGILTKGIDVAIIKLSKHIGE